MMKIGLVTIGQAPRTDVTPDIVAQLPDDVKVIEVGALDTFDLAAEVETAVGPVCDEPVFVTRLRDGSSVTIHRDSVIDRVQQRIHDIEDDVDTIGVLCTGHFPPFDSRVPILEPSPLLRAWATAIADGETIGIVMPKYEQIGQISKKWEEYEVVTAVGSPYADGDEVMSAAKEIDKQADLIVMDCMGYTPKMKRTIREITGTSVLLGRSVLAKTMTEIL